MARLWFPALVVATFFATVQNTHDKPASGRQATKSHVIQCPESPVPGERPTSMECAILIRKTFSRLPQAPVAWRLETFPSMKSVQEARTGASVVVRAGGKVWLMSLSEPGKRSNGGQFIAEVGPLPLPPADSYEFLIAEAHAGSDAMNLPHTHSGPEAWYVLEGKQCVETPDGVKSAKAGEGMFEPADTPMRLTILGPEIRDAFFIVVHDPALPWNTSSQWQPKDMCVSQ
jgi:mannose-6-phosphate isomerase-like protein (cupin superfamily)